MLERLPSLRIIEHPLERVVHTQAFPDLLHRASVVPCVGSRGYLRAQDERPHRRQVWEALVALDVPEVVVEENEPRLVNRRDRHAVVARPVPRRLLQIPKRSSKAFTLARLDMEKQAELARGANRKARANSPRLRHPYLPSIRRSKTTLA